MFIDWKWREMVFKISFFFANNCVDALIIIFFS